jgi:hypothetical protein
VQAEDGNNAIMCLRDTATFQTSGQPRRGGYEFNYEL